MIRQPSIWKIITKDDIAYKTWWSSILVPIILPISTIFERGTENLRITEITIVIWLATWVIIWLWAAVKIIRRIRVIQWFFNEGIETPAKITGISAYESRCSLLFEYEIQGEELNEYRSVTLEGKLRALCDGDRLTLLVNPKKFDEFIIRDLFLQDERNFVE